MDLNQTKRLIGLRNSLFAIFLLICFSLTIPVSAMSNPPASKLNASKPVNNLSNNSVGKATAAQTTALDTTAIETQAIITNTAENFKRDPNKQKSFEVTDQPISEKNYLADIRVHSPQELTKILLRAEMLLDEGEFEAGQSAPVVFLLHGDEARVLFKNQYSQNKQLVDLAAKLSAFNVVDIKVCEVWMRKNSLDKQQLQPFVSPVGYAPAEQQRLIKEEQYQYF